MDNNKIIEKVRELSEDYTKIILSKVNKKY